ncbi:MAG TPA: two-component regulator propeller domain-containing protein, partial [Niastella sp.]
MKTRLYFVVLIVVCPLFNYSQEYSYTHYGSKDGLAGSQVYCMTQDKEGFLWFATETGVSRFDGTHFKNFTREDGLPDNEIIQLFADSKGRVWMAPFKKSVCYYYKGKIYNSKNDPRIRQLHFQDNIYQFAEDGEGNIMMQDRYRLNIIKTNGEVTTLSTIGKRPFEYISLIAQRRAGGFWVLDKDSIYVLYKNRFTFREAIEFHKPHFNYVRVTGDTLIWRNQLNQVAFHSLLTSKTNKYSLVRDSGFVSLALVGNQHVGFCTANGVNVADINDPGNMQPYLPGKLVSNMFEDSEGNWWFCTLGTGVYRLNSAMVMSLAYTIKGQPNRHPEVFNNKEWRIMSNTLDVVKNNSVENGKRNELPGFAWLNFNPVVDMIALPGNEIALGTGGFIAKIKPDLSLSAIIHSIAVKALCVHKNTLLLATTNKVLSIDLKTFKILDTIWTERAT